MLINYVPADQHPKIYLNHSLVRCTVNGERGHDLLASLPATSSAHTSSVLYNNNNTSTTITGTRDSKLGQYSFAVTLYTPLNTRLHAPVTMDPHLSHPLPPFLGNHAHIIMHTTYLYYIQKITEPTTHIHKSHNSCLWCHGCTNYVNRGNVDDNDSCKAPRSARVVGPGPLSLFCYCYMSPATTTTINADGDRPRPQRNHHHRHPPPPTPPPQIMMIWQLCREDDEDSKWDSGSTSNKSET